MADPLGIPASTATVRVQMIDTTTELTLPTDIMISHPFRGHETMICPSYSFLITHEARSGAAGTATSSSYISGDPSPTRTIHRLLFDLGVRPDWHNLALSVADNIRSKGWGVRADADVAEILSRLGGIAPADVGAIVWSHWHWDHLGDPSRFPPATDLVVGPGFKANFLPGYPADPDGVIRESDYAGRRVVEISFENGDVLAGGQATGARPAGSHAAVAAPRLQIGGLDAHDYFGDGSFYLLHAPGHAIGHLCALARVQAAGANPSPASPPCSSAVHPPSSSAPFTTDEEFILLGADACHHAGEFRPSRALPLPEHITPHPFDPEASPARTCPGALFAPLLKKGDSTRPFYRVVGAEKEGKGEGEDDGLIDDDGPVDDDGDDEDGDDVRRTERTTARIQRFDADPRVLVCMAHDATLTLPCGGGAGEGDIPARGGAEDGRRGPGKEGSETLKSVTVEHAHVVHADAERQGDEGAAAAAAEGAPPETPPDVATPLVDVFPADMRGFRSRAVKSRGRWLFLRDFKGAAGA